MKWICQHPVAQSHRKCQKRISTAQRIPKPFSEFECVERSVITNQAKNKKKQKKNSSLKSGWSHERSSFNTLSKLDRAESLDGKHTEPFPACQASVDSLAHPPAVHQLQGSLILKPWAVKFNINLSCLSFCPSSSYLCLLLSVILSCGRQRRSFPVLTEENSDSHLLCWAGPVMQKGWVWQKFTW